MVICSLCSAALTQLRTGKNSHKKQLPVQQGEESVSGAAILWLSPESERIRETRARKAEHSSGSLFRSRGRGDGWNELVPTCHFSACREKSWCPGLWDADTLQEPRARSPPHPKCDSSAERDVGQGSSGFSSFDGHGTHFHMVQGLLFIFILFFFFLFCFNLLFSLGFACLSLPQPSHKIMCLSTDRIHPFLVKEAL